MKKKVFGNPQKQQLMKINMIIKKKFLEKNNHKDAVKMVSDLGYDEEYATQCLEKNKLNLTTTNYYLFSNYENVK